MVPSLTAALMTVVVTVVSDWPAPAMRYMRGGDLSERAGHMGGEDGDT
jgi:hypothetical protein